ncbi:dihydroneopterin aldolase [Porphyromonas levii]|uniref:dihydroneopterin aldolase n=1 Tax=Porphyromonas levii TaxID=28114 RepID=UPI00037BBE4E|nr:dihydroneopterin aldolase [Porphyromonas levii]MBR8713188.1 Dihydroneopterin aldolase [Porphyromonas levii]MBR8715193.1 Dihydroneopterin aldolase [Porphyromonas levii]MBR8727719.1 Dihydroneopterin aldolase [Porphyromonas levii]MBR8729230.1 Dihydroneopterin aldolase [Porphyromonas levii]MBR8731304.1 Dihydroneopterin aldolase [Porphyromonas levii]
MKLTHTSIKLEKLHFYSYHGLLEQEKSVGNDFEVSLEFHFPALEVMVTGDLAEGINYALIYKFIEREMAIPTELLEVLCYRMLEHLKEEFPLISQATLSITKLAPPIEGFDGAGISFSATANYEAN